MLLEKLRQFVEAPSAQKIALAESIREQASDADLLQLGGILEGSPDAACEAALRVLLAGSVPLNSEGDIVLRQAIPKLVRSEYPKPVGLLALMAWRLLDREASYHFLTTELDLETAVGIDGVEVVADLAATPGFPATRLLVQLAERADQAGAEARRWLEFRAPSPDRLNGLRDKWLADASGAALSALYEAFGTRLQMGVTTREDVIACFGEPDRADEVLLQYTPNPGVSASFELGADGRVVGVHLT